MFLSEFIFSTVVQVVRPVSGIEHHHRRGVLPPPRSGFVDRLSREFTPCMALDGFCHGVRHRPRKMLGDTCYHQGYRGRRRRRKVPRGSGCDVGRHASTWWRFVKPALRNRVISTDSVSPRSMSPGSTGRMVPSVAGCGAEESIISFSPGRGGGCHRRGLEQRGASLHRRELEPKSESECESECQRLGPVLKKTSRL